MLVVMSGASDASSPSGPGGFEEILKDFWVSRPRRPLAGRKVAGVAVGIGRRYGIDPVLVRVVFATATVFGGVGFCLYVLAWLLFPGENDQVSPIEALLGRGRSSTSRGFTIALVILLFPLTSWAFAGGWFNGGGVIGLALLVTGLYLLHRGRGHVNRPVVPVEQTAAGTFSMPSMASAASAPMAERSSGGWDPLGAPPLGWDLPDPTPPPPPVRQPAPRRRRNAAVGLTTFAIALVVAGAGVALGASGASWFSPQHIIGLALGVLGVGMVTGAFLNGGRGLVAWAIPLSVAGLVTTAVPINDYTGGFGDINAAPRTAAQVLPVYQHTAGDVDLDLTRLEATTPVSTIIRNGAGTTTVLVPANADVRYTCRVEAGDVNCLDHEADGLQPRTVAGTDPGPDGVGGPQIYLNITQGAGSVEVRRG